MIPCFIGIFYPHPRDKTGKISQKESAVRHNRNQSIFL